MQQVKFKRTISHMGKMYLRGSKVSLDQSQVALLKNYVEVLNAPQRVDIVNPQNTAIESPRPRKTKKRKKAVKRGSKS